MTDRFNSLYKSVNRGGYHRCTICNAVSNETIQTEVGDYKHQMSFVNDPNNPMHFICVSCNEVVDEQRYEYELWDEIK